VILPRGMPAEEFVIKVADKVRGTIQRSDEARNLGEDDLSEFLKGTMTRYFESEMRSQPLVNVRVNSVIRQVDESVARTKPQPKKAKK
ncbi:MAG: hypothetical protein K8F91_00230, partial [Candidatus Obscuribacterales bacterium]|nr:hypothetical protein [Candidatus Obscuribacterales bacterium]